MRVQPRVPGTEARDGKFPGPSLLPALTAIQREHGWLPRETLTELSREQRRPLYEIEGLISFYPHFRTEPPSKIDLHVCHDLSCWLHGSDERIAEIKAALRGRRRGRDPGGVVPGALRHRTGGRGRRAPGGGGRHRSAGRGRARVRRARPAEAQRGEAPRANDPYAPRRGALPSAAPRAEGELSAEQIITALKDSELRGMGGAGFPTGEEVGAGRTAGR